MQGLRIVYGAGRGIYADVSAVCGVLFGRYQHRGALVFYEEHDELRRLGFAGIAADNVDVIRAFVEGLTRPEGHFLAASYLLNDRSLENIDERIGIVAMYGVDVARRIFHGDHHAFLAGRFGEVFGHELGDFGLLCEERA